MIELNKPYIIPDDLVLVIERDPYPENPRQWDDFSTFVTNEFEYNSPDANPFSTYVELLNTVCTGDYYWDFVIRIDDEYQIMDETTYTKCACGIIYVHKNHARQSFPRIPNPILSAHNIFESVIKDYNSWCRGDVLQYVLYSMDGDVLESCGGIYGDVKDVLDCLGLSEDELEEAFEVKSYGRKES